MIWFIKKVIACGFKKKMVLVEKYLVVLSCFIKAIKEKQLIDFVVFKSFKIRQTDLLINT